MPTKYHWIREPIYPETTPTTRNRPTTTPRAKVNLCALYKYNSVVRLTKIDKL